MQTTNEIIVGNVKYTISTIRGLVGANITLPEGKTTAFMSIKTLQLLLEEILALEEQKR